LTDVVTWILALLLSVMPNQLGCGNAADDAFGQMATVVWARVTPCVLLLAYEDDVVIAVGVPVTVTIAAVFALGIVSLLATTSAIYLLHLAFVVVVLLPAWLSACDLSLLCKLGTLDDLVLGFFAAHNNLLSYGLLENDGLWGVLADDDGLYGWGLWAEKLCRFRISLELIWGGSCGLELVLALYAILALSRGRGRAFDLAFDAVFADLATLGRGRALDVALDEAVLAHFARGGVVSLDNILPDLAALLDLDWFAVAVALALAMDEAQLGFVGVFLETSVGHLVALDGGVAAAWAAGRGGFPVALGSVDCGHGCGRWCSWQIKGRLCGGCRSSRVLDQSGRVVVAAVTRRGSQVDQRRQSARKRGRAQCAEREGTATSTATATAARVKQ